MRYLGLLAAVAAEAGDLQRAQALLDESVSLNWTAGDPLNLLTTTIQLGWLAVTEGRLDDAESHFQKPVDLEAGWGGKNFAPALLGLGLVNVRRGDPEHARALYCQVLGHLQESAPGSALLADALVYMASVDAVDGLHERAQRLIGASEAWRAARARPRDGVRMFEVHCFTGWCPFRRCPLIRCYWRRARKAVR
jgi:tetratricopeptide (TPR) repeat protein